MRIIKTAAPFIILFLLGIGLYYSNPLPMSARADTVSGPQIECGLQDMVASAGSINGEIGGGDPTGTIVSAVFNWGDGTSNTVTTSQYPNADCPKGVYLYPLQFASPIVSHTFNAQGQYIVQQCLVDNQGLQGCEHFLVQVGPSASAYQSLGGGARPRNL